MSVRAPVSRDEGWRYRPAHPLRCVARGISSMAGEDRKAMSRCYLIQDPYHVYAASFIDVIFRTWGHKAICLYTDEKVRFYEQDAFPILDSDRIETSVDLDGESLAAVAKRLQARYDIAGIVPFSEPTVANAAELAAQLGLSWCSPEVVRRFRDKFALKQWLRERYPSLRLNASRRVTSVADVLAEPLPDRYVLKPNDGFGNSAIGMFDKDTPRQRLEDFFRAHPPRNWLLEEFIGGTEYFVNGQVGAHGEIDVFAIFEYERRPANGRENLDHLTWRLPRSAPEYEQLEHYARQVVAATGLIRSPFHLEAKIDEKGPCLIEVGARLVGNGNAYVCNELHGNSLDLFHVAAHHYLSAEPYGPLPLDWKHYDATELVYVHGVSTETAVVETLEGMAEVERLPEFAGWVRRPTIGMQVVPTVGLLTSPYCLLLRGNSKQKLREVSSLVRALITWNRSADAASTVQALGYQLKEKLSKRLGWELYGKPLSRVRKLALL